jgi:hypothetical protein
MALSFHCMMRVRFSGATWDYAHLVPVKRKLFAALQTDYISAGLLCSSWPRLTCSGRKRETQPPVPAAEEDIGPCEICVHDFVPNPSLLETKSDNCELDHATLSAIAIVGLRLKRSSLCQSRVSQPVDPEAMGPICILKKQYATYSLQQLRPKKVPRGKQLNGNNVAQL